METPFKEDVLQGQVALVTGGATGICKGVARWLGKHGASLMLVSRNPDHLKAAAEGMTAEGLKVAWHAADVRKDAEVQAAVDACKEKLGGLHILVNGAAGNFLCPAAALSTNGFRTVVEIDLVGTFAMSRAAFPLLCDGHGTIINISATLHYGASPLMTHAVAAKAGIDALTRNLAVEWGPLGVRVNGIAPGPIDGTEGMARLVPGKLRDALISRIPARRLGTVDDIGQAAVFLASRGASYVNGTTLVVDGAAWMTGHFQPEDLMSAG